MPVKVWIPPQLRAVTRGNTQVEANGETVKEVLLDVERQFPDLKDRMRDEKGEIRPFLNVYVNDEDIRFLQSYDTVVKEGDEFAIIPAVGGG
jgi:molybdopterin synthase sulfur carrier subunit